MECIKCGYEGEKLNFSSGRNQCKNCFNAYARNYGRKYRLAHPEVAIWSRMGSAISNLKKALRDVGPLKNGWPDDGVSIELKIGYDTINPDQFRRFAWLQQRGIEVLIRIADSHETCSVDFEDLSISNYLRRICDGRGDEVVQLWDQLVKTFKGSL